MEFFYNPLQLTWYSVPSYLEFRQWTVRRKWLRQAGVPGYAWQFSPRDYHGSVKPESLKSTYDETYNIVFQVMKFVGLRLGQLERPLAKRLWDTFYWFEFFNLFFVTFLELIYIANTVKEGSFEAFVATFKMMPCVGYITMAQIKSSSIVRNRQVYENLIHELREQWPTHELTAEEKTILKDSLKMLRMVIKVYYWCNNALMAVFLSPPFVQIAKVWLWGDVPLILPFFYWFPFDPLTHPTYEIILAFQTWHGLITIWFMVISDLLFCITMSHTSLHLDLLAVKLRSLVCVPQDEQLPRYFPTGKYSQEYQEKRGEGVEGFSHEDWESRHMEELKILLERHKVLVRLAVDIEGLFSFSLLVNFMNSSIVICFCGFCVVIVESMTEMVYKSFLASAVIQIWLLCWYGQRLLDSSTGVSVALYECGWYQASQRVKSSIAIALHRTQKAEHVTTYGFSVLSLSSYAAILRTSWSYFMLLLNVYNK